MNKPAKQGSEQAPKKELSILFRRLLYLFVVVIAAIAAGSSYVEQWNLEAIHPSFGLTDTKSLSDYLPSLKGSRGDTDIYVFKGREEGGTILILGGTHPNEPASNLAAVLLIENLKVETGTVIVMPRANESGFTATEPQEAFPQSLSITNRKGNVRKFRVGSRFTNILDGWPDPVVYRHHPSRQTLSGNETRNLNRAFPGKKSGSLTERIAFAITELVKAEDVDLLIDLHEAAPEYPVINAIVAHENAIDIAAMATVELQMKDLEFRLEPSPENFHGLSHREIGDFTEAKAMLFESAGAMQGRLRGPTDEAIVLESKDALYHKVSELGKLEVDFPEDGIPLEIRVGRHIEAIKSVCLIASELYPGIKIEYSNVPEIKDLMKHGFGFFLN